MTRTHRSGHPSSRRQWANRWIGARHSGLPLGPYRQLSPRPTAHRAPVLSVPPQPRPELPHPPGLEIGIELLGLEVRRRWHAAPDEPDAPRADRKDHAKAGERPSPSDTVGHPPDGQCSEDAPNNSTLTTELSSDMPGPKSRLMNSNAPDTTSVSKPRSYGAPSRAQLRTLRIPRPVARRLACPVSPLRRYAIMGLENEGLVLGAIPRVCWA
jgi:hypothetical protein